MDRSHRARHWRWIHRVANSPHFQLIVGVLVAWSGISELIDDTNAGLTRLIRPHHGVVVLGFVHAFLASESVLFGGASVAATAHGEVGGLGRGVKSVMRRPSAEMLFGGLLLVTGVSDVVSDWIGHSKNDDDDVWHFGLVLMGLVGLSKGLATRLHEHSRVVARIHKVLHLPHVEVAVSVCVLSLGVLQELVFEVHHSERGWLKAHYGTVLSSFAVILQRLPAIALGAQLVTPSAAAERTQAEHTQ